MRKILFPLLAIASSCGGAQAQVPAAANPATTSAAIGQPSPRAMRLAEDLVDLIHPDRQMFESNMRGWEAASRKTAAVDPMFSRLEAEYPGTIEAAIKSASPVAQEYAHHFVNRAKKEKTEIFAARLSPAEMEQLLGFFRQPVGQRLVTGLQTYSDADGFADRIAEKSQEGSVTVTVDDVNASLRKRSRSTLKAMSADDIVAIAKFEKEPVAKKFAAAGQEADQAVLKIMNNPPPEYMTRIGEAAMEGAIAFVEQQKTEKK